MALLAVWGQVGYHSVACFLLCFGELGGAVYLSIC